MKKGIMYTLLGGSLVLGYMLYRDGTITRTVKNLKPKLANSLERMKK